MNQKEITAHIEKRKEEKAQLELLCNFIVSLDEEVGLSANTYKEVQAKVSSRMAFCEISIRDHEKLLNVDNTKTSKTELGLHDISGSAGQSAQITKTANSECINQCFNCCNRHFDGIINGHQINTCLRFNKNIANIYEEGCEKWNERN